MSVSFATIVSCVRPYTFFLGRPTTSLQRMTPLAGGGACEVTNVPCMRTKVFLGCPKLLFIRKRKDNSFLSIVKLQMMAPSIETKIVASTLVGIILVSLIVIFYRRRS